MRIKIGNKFVGEEEPCFVIAEAGVNHNGDIEVAKKLVDAAASANADAIKFQTFISSELATSDVQKAGYQKKSADSEESQLDMLKRLELSQEEFRELKAYCDKSGILFLSTPFDFRSADLLENLGVQAYKISSGDLNNYPFLSYIAKKGRPMIVSTGMAEMEEIKKALECIKKENNAGIVLLQCTSAYPAPYDEVHLNSMHTLGQLSNAPIGFSDHTLGIEVSIAAVALGACVIEKHFTLNKSMDGPDHKASIDPVELTALVKSIRNVERALGSFQKGVAESEKENRKISRKKIVAAKDLTEGEIIVAASLALKRSSEGLDPSFFENIIGKKINRSILKDQPIKMEYLQK